MRIQRHAQRATVIAGGLTCLMLAAAACSSSSSTSGTGAAAVTSSGPSASSAASSQTIKSVTYVNPLPSYPDFNVVGQCFKAQAQKYGWQANEVGITGTAVDNQGSINQISQAIADGSNALLVFPTVDQMFAPVMKQARSKGIDVVALNTGDPTTGQQTEVGSDDTQMGKLMADGLGAKDPDAVVGFLSLSASTQAHAQIIAGFKAEAAARFPKMTFPVSAYDNGDATQDVDIFNNMIAAHPTLTAIFPVEGAAIPAAITAVKEAGKTSQINIVGFDLTAITQADIKAGTLYGVVNQGWCDMGTKAVIAMKDLSEGKTVPAFIPTQITFITKQNLPAQS
jgi:ribose transport system substrate-binding protein